MKTTIKLRTPKKLGGQMVKVEVSQHNYRSALVYQLNLAKAQRAYDSLQKSSDDPLAQRVKLSEISEKLITNRADFLTDIFDLNEKQQTALDDCTTDELDKLAMSTCEKLMNIDAQPASTQKQTIGEWVDALENAVQDIDYEEQIAFQYLHILPDDFEKQNFMRLQQVMNAKSRQDRVVKADTLLERLGLNEKNAGQITGKGVKAK